MKLICDIYRCAKKEGMYLYIETKKNFDDLPEALVKQLGKTEFSMTLLLTPEKKLARADAAKIIETIHSQGFYLQMPPSTFQAP